MTQRQRTAFVVSTFLALCVGALLTQYGGLRINGIAPNIMLALLIVVAYGTDNPLFYGMMVILAMSLVRYTPALFDREALSFGAVGLLIFFGGRRLFAPGVIGTSCLSAIGVIATYVMLEPNFLVTHPLIILLEILYTGVISAGLWYGMTYIFGRHA